ncbi:unnamed protein product [Brassica oleracea var. botrytis]|uniref:BnaC04g32410D protein n=5 Tax=Brassica TaxID=3705 RepID=A0A078HJ28_BRANA|nr:PREDICTED: uncharacterized protein LOC106340520 [Brassica oleracea var. oleracea]KAH0885635.1 hypothetical protein HID58_061731 [Brassica napus]CAF1859106.1 unnamed protein product [Brassica napus]CDY36848.1 BnaC04g32410D [Brassica napus]VDD11745.1 unnamed protein product [Brassica oleracea]
MSKSKKFSLKLLVDEKRNKVVLAEADHDFVDVLISLLSLPMGKIARLLESHKDLQTVLACYQNLNRSVADMGIEHFETEACKSMLLSPKSSYEIHCRKLKLNMGDTDATKFFICSNYLSDDSTCGHVYSNFNTSTCRCGDRMSTRIFTSEEDQGGEEFGNSVDGVFVNCRSSFIVTDNLKVSVNSIGVIMNVLNDQGYTDFSDLQETLLDIGFEEVLTLLGCFFTTETPLTCAFLMKPCMTLKILSPHLQNSEIVEPSSVFSVKLFVRKFDNEILYAECNSDFIDALLSFLIFPLELICSLSSILGCVENLCRSPCRKASASNFNQVPDYYSCSSNTMFGYLPSPSPVYECFVPRNSSDSWSCQLARQIQWSMDLLIISGDIVKMSPNNPKVISGSSSRCDTGFMKKNTKFIVSNDLNISPMNSFSTIGLLKKMQVNISDLEEQQISISRAELISILRASLVSSSALTNGLSNFLVKKPKRRNLNAIRNIN